nr:unnamed protein product [Callosobruchus analis]
MPLYRHRSDGDGVYPARGYEQTLLLNGFKMECLQQRTILSGFLLLYSYKIVNNQIDPPELLSYICFHVPQVNTRQNVTFYTQYARTDIILSPINEFPNACLRKCQRLEDIKDFSWARGMPALVKQKKSNIGNRLQTYRGCVSDNYTCEDAKQLYEKLGEEMKECKICKLDLCNGE